MPQQRWTREQTLSVLFLNLEYKRRLTPTNLEVVRLAKAMNRTPAAICKLDGNFVSLDSFVSREMSNAAKLTREIWDEYERDPERVLAEARGANLNLVG